MEIAAHLTLTANSTSSFPTDPPKLPNTQLRSPNTSPSGNNSNASSGTPGGLRDEDDFKNSIEVQEGRTDTNGSFLDRLLSPASERPTPGQVRFNRFSRNITPDHAPSPKLSFSEGIAPTNIDYQSLPSPPEPWVVGYVDDDFGFEVQCAYKLSVMREKWRLNKYGEYALKYKRGFTPSPLRRAYIERQEELTRLAETETTDSETPPPSPTHQAYLARQEEYMRLVKLRTIDSEPPSPSQHPAGSNAEAKHQVSESLQASDITSRPDILEGSSEEHLLPEAQVSPAPVSLPAYSDVAVDQEDSAMHVIPKEHLDQKTGNKRRRDDTDEGLRQEEPLGVVGYSVKERQIKRAKHAPT